MNETNIPTNYGAPQPVVAPVKSTAETLTGIFFEPGETFEALRPRPRFLVAGLIILALTLLFTFVMFQRINFEQFMRAQIENSPRADQMSPEQKEQAISMQSGTLGKAIAYGAPPIVLAIVFAAGGALYLLGTMAMAGSISYKQAISVWVYSTLPPGVLFTIANVLVLFLKSPDDIDPSQAQGGFVTANPSFLLGAGASPVWKAALGSLDLLAFYGLFLGALGLRKVGRLSSGAAWAVVLIIWLIGTVMKVGWAAAFG